VSPKPLEYTSIILKDAYFVGAWGSLPRAPLADAFHSIYIQITYGARFSPRALFFFGPAKEWESGTRVHCSCAGSPAKFIRPTLVDEAAPAP